MRVGGESIDSQVSELSQEQGSMLIESEVQSVESDSDTSDIAESQGGSAENCHNIKLN